MILSDAAIRNRTTVGVISFVIIIAGAYCYMSLPREAAPDVPVPFIIVTTVYEGVSPEDVESAVTLKIEKELTGLKGVKEIRSTSAEGVSMVQIEFMPDVEIDDAMQYVRDRIDRAKPELPREAEDPTLTEVNVADFPIMMINISGDISPVRLKAIADELEERIEGIQGVLNCDVVGAIEREIRLEFDQDRLTAYGLTIPEILQLIPSENVNISAGGLATPGTKFNVRTPAEFVTPEDIDALPVAERNGKLIYLTDVVKIRDTFKDRTTYSRLDGRESLTVTVQKRVGENILYIAEAVKVVLERFREAAPEGVRFDVTLDQSKDIRSMVLDLENNLASGMILVVVVLVLFMGWRASMVVALAIPMSMLLSFVVITALGYTLNMIVLFSLIMALGMLVDNAIVIVENIYRHYSISGKRLRAAMVGTGEVAWPVITSTATTVVAFAPLIFWPGMMGEFMKYLPITLIITLTASLFVALVINPVVSSLFVRRTGDAPPRESGFLRGYRRLLATTMQHRFTTLALALLVLTGLGMLYTKLGHGVELFPDIEARRAIVSVRMPQGTNIDETNAVVAEIERRLQPFRERMENVIANVGTAGGAAQMGGQSGGEHLATITLTFHDYEVREYNSDDVLKEVRVALADIPGAEIKVEKEEEGPPTGAAVEVQFIGEDFRMLEALSDQGKRVIESVAGLVNLRSDHEAARPELAMEVDRRRALLLGVNTAIVGEFLKMANFGSEVGKYREYDEEYDITVRLPEAQRRSVDDLFRLHVPNALGEAIPLSSLGRFRYTGGLGTIRHINRDRVVTLEGDAEGRLDTEVLADVKARLAQELEGDLPSGYLIHYAGKDEEQQKAEAFLSKAFAAALFLIVIILVAQFNTLIVPLIIMTTVILSLIGVFVGLIVCQMPFGIIMTGVGVISLAGVVVNNAIVLLDYTRQLQQRGMGLIEASIQAGATRLRPVLLTATTTILGLIPMAIGVAFDFHKMEIVTRSESSQWWRSMAIAVIFGLAFATMLTLFVVPTLYVTLTRLAEWLGVRSGPTPIETDDEPASATG